MIETAHAAFNAYNQRAGGLTYDGKPIPPWEDVGPKVRNRWRAAIAAVTPEDANFEDES